MTAFYCLQDNISNKKYELEYILTHERRYWYLPEGGLAPEVCDPQEGAAAQRWEEHGNRTWVGGPAFEAHTARSHMDRDGDVKRVDMEPEFNVDPYTINSRDTIGGEVDIVVTGVERARYAEQGVDGVFEGVEYDTPRVSGDEAVDDTGAEEDKLNIIVVSYDGDIDPMDPHNWSFVRRFACTTLVSLLGALAFSTPPSRFNLSQRVSQAASKQVVNTRLTRLALAFFLILLGFGGMLTGPLSEVGRNPVYIVCLTLFIILDSVAAIAQNLPQRIICRGLTGLFASGPLVCSAATLVDLWALVERVYTVPYYAMMLKLAATVAPVPGSFIVQSNSVSWRWVVWTTNIFAGLLLALVVLFLPETYSPTLLQWKAQQLRRLTDDSRFRAPLEFKKVALRRRLRNALSRPIKFFWKSLSSWYLPCFALDFEDNYGLNKGETGLCFLAVATGVVLANILVPLQMRDIRHARRHRLRRPEPECNLYTGMFAAPIIPLSLLWMGWTARPSISIWCPLTAALFFGFGILGAVIASYQYITATFEYHTASALATIQATRSTTAGGSQGKLDVDLVGGDRDDISAVALLAL
ncbi:uncharacterized protein N7473_000746 [Penicillium subrubescens]|uniref:uncharacterized protein n=1 Tax=Penicillium subrubescens TaxID=1316194 RepID=UPI0025451986|nr:uncharacterized protein N7473_000746 [Penicillium subrubescens]KAJ5911443.1 hypothetical protein N7473_000746 [Penicillium subrubescens]